MSGHSLILNMRVNWISLVVKSLSKASVSVAKSPFPLPLGLMPSQADIGFHIK